VSIQRAVVLVGSAKPAGTSTSEALGQYLCARLQKHGVATTVLFLSRSLKSLPDRALNVALADADLFVLTTPVYIDSLPYLVTRTLEDLARSARPGRSPCVFAAIVNCGFPEAGQCRTALDILHAFARRARFNWAGGLALGEGGVIDGQSLEALGGLTRHVQRRSIARPWSWLRAVRSRRRQSNRSRADSSRHASTRSWGTLDGDGAPCGTA
jgi:hypothetical protein